MSTKTHWHEHRIATLEKRIKILEAELKKVKEKQIATLACPDCGYDYNNPIPFWADGADWWQCEGCYYEWLQD